VGKRRKNIAGVESKTARGKSQGVSSNQPDASLMLSASTLGGMTTPQKVAWYALLALVFCVPLATSNWTWLGISIPFTFDQFDLVKVFVMRACVLVGLAAWAWHILFYGGRIRRTKADYLILVFLGWVFLTTLTSIHPETAFFGKYRRYEGLMSFITYGGVFFLATQLLDRTARIRTLAKTFFFSAVGVNGYGVLQSLGMDPNRWGQLPFEANRAFSTFGNPDLLGGFIVFSLAVSLGLALSENRPGWRAVWWAGFLIAVWCWIAAFTRGAWIGGSVALLIIIAVAITQKVKLKRTDGIFAGAIGILVAALVSLSLRSENPVMNVWLRLKSIFEFDAGSAETRFQIWQAALTAIQERPILGYGADTFRLHFPRYKPLEYVADAGYLSVADNAHNYPLQMASALGIPGFLLLYGLFIFVAIATASFIFKRTSGSVGDKLILAGMWAGCAGYLTHMNFGLAVTGTAVFMWVFMAALMAPTARFVEVKPQSGALVGAVAATVLAAALLIFNFTHVIADNYHLRASVMSQGFDRVRYAEAAVRLNPFNDQYRTELAMAHLDIFVTYLPALQAGDDSPEALAVRAQAEQQFRTTERAMLDAIEFSPWEFDNYVFLTNLYVAGGEFLDRRHFESAIYWGRKGVDERHFIYGPALRLQLARALYATGDVQAAYDEISFAASMDPNFSQAHFFHAVIAESRGDLVSARKALTQVLLVQPDFPTAADFLARVESAAAATSN